MSKAKKDNDVKPKVAPKRSKNNVVNNKKPIKDGVVPRFANNGYRLPDPLPKGEILTDNFKGQWIIGDVIGCGGFGEIYLAKRNTNDSKNQDTGWDYVVKVDNYTGPLFPEIHFYHRVAKEKEIESWMQKQGLKFLGVPRYIASGIHDKPEPPPKPKGRAKKNSTSTSNNELPRFRFLVMQHFGRDLQSILNTHKKFSVKTTFTLAIKVIDALRFIHSFGYIHADIKASNLLLGRESAASKRTTRGCYSEVYLVDYGLVERFLTPEGQHRIYEEDQRRADNGTVEFTSRDAHIGALSRRSDLEILAYNVLSWLSGGRLPWMSNLKDHAYVKACKEYYMKHLHELVNYCFSKHDDKVDFKSKTINNSNSKSIIDRKKVSADVPYGVVEILQYIANLEFNEEPDYHLLKKILETGIEKVGEKHDGLFSFDLSPKLPRRMNSKTNLLPEKEKEEIVVVKRGRSRSRTNHSEVESPPKKAKSAPKNGVLNDKKTSQKSKVQKPVSAPTTLTPTKTSMKPAARTPTFDNPTPAMIEMLQKLKAKKLLK